MEPLILLQVLVAIALLVTGMYVRWWLDKCAAARRQRARTERLASLVGLTVEQFEAPDCRECGQPIPGQIEGSRCAACIDRLTKGLHS